MGQQKFSDCSEKSEQDFDWVVTRLKAQEGLKDVKTKKKHYTEKSVNLSLNSSWLSVVKNTLRFPG
jgi:hypothetical protein